MVTSESGYGDYGYRPGEVWEIDHGWDVYGADGEKIGDVQEVQSSYLIVSKGFFFPTERYIPVSAINDVRDDRVYLSVSKDEIDSRGWDSVDSLSGWTTTGTTGTTTTADIDTTYAGDARTTGMTYADTDTDLTRTRDIDEDVRIPVMEEELSVNKREVRRGLVRVQKRVVQEEASVNVPIREEEVRVERHAVDREYTGDIPADAFQETTIDIPLRGEEVDVSKRAVVREEVAIDKDVVERNQRVADTVRREEVVVDGDTTRRAGTTDMGVVTDREMTTGRMGMSGATDTEGDDPGEGPLGRLEDKLDPTPNEGGKPRGI